ncbi:MAG: ABC transporter permease [Bacteroidales bacterium]|nr:ABC transporter permease [Bacteroidales bacterium]
MISLVLVNLTVYLTDMIRIKHIKSCYHPDNVVCLGFTTLQTVDKDKISETFDRLKARLAANQFVESVSFSNNSLPFNYYMSMSPYKYQGKEIQIARHPTDIAYKDVMKIQPIKGRWFNKSDIGKSTRPILVTKHLDEKYFNGNAVGKVVSDSRNKYEIIGVVDEFKRSDYEQPYDAAFFFSNPESDKTWILYSDILVRVKPGQTENFLKVAEPELMTVMDPKCWVVSTQNSLENMRSVQNHQSEQKRLLGLLIAFFVIINILLGVIGILWYNTNLRIHEIGIRRALGSTGIKVRRLLITENLFMGILALFVVALVFIQVPSIRIFHVEDPVMYLSVAISVAVMIGLILISTWIPVAIASKIRPAEALKTE